MSEAIPTLYDETNSGKWHSEAQINGVGNQANLTGQLEHHVPSTDGSFPICVVSGNVTLVSRKLYESIPEQHRPPLDTNATDTSVAFVLSGPQNALGSTIMPVVLINAETGKPFCVKLHALVMEDLLMGMFIGIHDSIFTQQAWDAERITYRLALGNEEVEVEHRVRQ
ncbi:hypothetical protein V5O48_011053 [Marasmius crinis-equi]|uniref:Uncharacterized protein n=1 Tax=Marasmius crinis-equi TaxID=585013 RepID=A0ABR3F757_9AGAR